MELTRSRLLALAALTEGSAFVIAIALAAWRDIPLYPHDAPSLSDLLAGVLWTIPPLIFFFFLVSRQAAGIRGFAHLRRKMLEDVSPVFARAGAVDLFLIALMAGIAEECLFRGVLQAAFGIVISNVVFGLLHFVTPLYALIAALMGVYLGLLYDTYGNLIVPVQVHFLYDLTALLFLRYRTNRDNPPIY